ncbi:metallophosphoesterase [Vibrio agarivorans]|uniref:Metallophosphoesterase n=1 Tax=Vibrio agarivorans TaxID=153622 RepID=A0ABT7Y6B2_9VIBR|nr:metallophosphoesterase [Vibrio agarivorans]MDN2483596.1 metallophosphoesterase [Vibrio agarivorans]
MALIETKYINTLFSDLPSYGCRSNWVLWQKVENALIAEERAFSASELLDWVQQYIEELLCAASITNTAGLQESSADTIGQFDHNFWLKVMHPTLEKRCRALEKGLEFRVNNGMSRTVNPNFDGLYFVGDIHGQNRKLQALIQDLSISATDDKLVFLGDLIDNSDCSSTQQLEVLNQVKQLMDNGQALCVMGNHEFNAIGWMIKRQDGRYCRDRSKAGNLRQHQAFLDEVVEDSVLHKEWVEWFKTLPLFLNFGDVRAIHACWHEESIERLTSYLNSDNTLKEQHWRDAFDEHHELYHLIETLLKGPEVSLPEGCHFEDKHGNIRTNIRVAWWKSADSVYRYRDIAVVPAGQDDAIPDLELADDALCYNQTPLFPVIVGHYTMDPTPFPERRSDQVVCVDYNAAKGDYPLMAYYVSPESWWDSPLELLSEAHFCYVNEVIPNRYALEGVMKMVDQMVEALPKVTPSVDLESWVSEILFTEWDPIGVYDPEYLNDELRTEYSAIEEDVVKLVCACAPQQLCTYLLLMERYYYCVERDNSEHNCAKIAHKLVSQYKRNGCVN